MRRESWIVLLFGLWACGCHGAREQAPVGSPAWDAAPPSAPVPAASGPGAPIEFPVLPRTAVGRLVGGDERYIACGVYADVGLYVYEIVGVTSGPPLSGRIVVDVQCPDRFASPKVEFVRGELHRLTLGPAQLVYLGSLQRASPEPDALRFEATELAAY